MMRELADRITADTPEFARLVEALERAAEEFRAHPSRETGERWGVALEAFAAQCNKMNAYLRPVAEALSSRLIDP